MKGTRFGFAFVALVLLAAPLSAQSPRLGVKGGVPFSTLYGDAVNDAESIARFAVGAFAAFPVRAGLEIQPELLYVGRGAKGTAGGFDITVRTRYVQLPVLARLAFGSALARPALFAGPSFAVRTSCHAEVGSRSIRGSVDCDDAAVVPLFERYDFGVVFGGGIAFDLREAIVTVDGRYDLGLTAVNAVARQRDVKNRALTLLVGLSLPIGR